jgi:hypothetical protein
MSLTRNVVVKRDDFMRAQALTTTPAGEFGWTAKDTSSSGTPTYLCISDDAGALKLLCDNASEAQVVTAYQNNVLPFKIADLLYVEWNVLVAGVDAVTTIVWGICSAQNDTPDSTTNHAWFRMEGSASTSAIVVETDDGTTDLDDKATGKTLASAYKRCTIDFSYGLGDVRFFIDGSRVAEGVTFDFDQVSTNRCQLFAQLQKASGTGVPAFQVDYVEVAHRLAA